MKFDAALLSDKREANLYEYATREVRIIMADLEAGNADALTIGAAERLVEKLRHIKTHDEVLHNGKTPGARRDG